MAKAVPQKNKLLLAACTSILLGCATLFHGPLHANPDGGSVTAGQATISQSAGLTQIHQSSDKAVIDWRGFSIGSGEETRFTQPGSGSIALNRVNGGNASIIAGRLNANGQVWLINPSGIIFNKGSQVNVAGLLATTANIKNNDFMAGNYHFIQDANRTAGIINEGTITVQDRGLVALVAPGVANNGTIVARLGKVTLASGTKFTVDLKGDQLIQFDADSQVTQSPTHPVTGKKMQNAVANSGKIFADGGHVVLSANAVAGIVDNAINMDGIIEAKSMGSQSGRIVLAGGNGITQVSGTLDVQGLNSGEKGGTVHISGKKIGLLAGAKIKASGKAGGGEVLVGGDYHGSGPMPQADLTYMDKDAVIEADATEKGNGGKVILWSDITNPNSSTRSYGTISAKGGPLGGDGGFIETSGHYLDVNGISINTSAPMGTFGTWLLDPENMIIQDNGGSNSGIGTFSAGSNTEFSAEADNAILDIGILLNALGFSNVLIETTAGPPGAQSGDITINTAIQPVGPIGGDLTINAAGSIFINANIDMANDTNPNRNLTLIAGNSINTNGPINLNGNNITLTASTINLTNTTLAVAGDFLNGGGTGNLTATNAINLTGVILRGTSTGAATTNFNLTGTNISLNNVSAPVFSGTNLSSSLSINSSSVLIIASGGLTFATGNGTQTVSAGIIDLNGAINSGATTGFTSITPASTVNLTPYAGNSNQVNQGLQLLANGGALTFNGGDYTSAGAINITNPAVGNLTLNGTAPITVASISSAAPTTLMGTVNSSGSQSYTNTVNLNSSNVSLSASSVTLGSTVTANNHSLSLTVSSSTTLNGSNFSNLNSLTTNGAGTITLTGPQISTTNSQTYNNPLSASGNLTLTSTNNSVIALNSTFTNNSGNLTISGPAALNGSSITTSGTQTYMGAVTSNSSNLSLTGSNIILDSTFNGTGNLTINGSANLNGSSVTTSGTQTYTGAVTLGGNPSSITLTGNGMTFGSTITGANNLNLVSSNNIVFTTADTISGLTSLSVSGTASNNINFIMNGSMSITTAQGISFHNTNLNSTGAVSLTTGGGNGISIVTSDQMAQGNFTSSGTINLDAGGAAPIVLANTMLTAGTGMSLNNASNLTLAGSTSGVTVGSSTQVTVSNIPIINLNGLFTTGPFGTSSFGTAPLVQVNVTNPALGTSNTGTITAGSRMVSNGGTLIVGNNKTNGGIYNEEVNFTSAIHNPIINVQTNGAVTVNSLTAANDITLGFQGTWNTQGNGNFTFNGPLSLTGTTALNSGAGNIVFNNTVNGSHALTLSSSGITSLTSAIGNLTPLSSFTITSSGGTTLLNNNISTNGALTLGNAVNLFNNTILSSGNGTIAINNSFNGGYAATLTSNGITAINGAIGGSAPLSSFTITGTAGNTQLANNISTSGAMTLNNVVNLMGNSILTSGSTISLPNTVDGNQALTLNAAGTKTITGNIGDNAPVASFTSGGAGTLQLGANVSAQGGAITFNDVVQLINNVALTNTSSQGIGFNNILNGTYNLAANATQGNISFAQAVQLANLIINNARNVTTSSTVNVASFNQSHGSGTTNFAGQGLQTNGNVAVNTGVIRGTIKGNNVFLNALNGMFVNVTANSLTLNGQGGGTINGIVAGFNDFRAALATDLLSSAAGNFFVNGCLAPGGSCLSNTFDSVLQIMQNIPQQEPPVCTLNASGKGSSNKCNNIIKIQDEHIAAL